MVRDDILPIRSCKLGLEVNGEIGVIHWGSGYCYAVLFDNDQLNDYVSISGQSYSDRLFREESLTTRCKVTRLAKKLFPKAIEKDGWLYGID